jgi:hypothetical protein
MDITANIKRLREQHGLIQKQVAGHRVFQLQQNGKRAKGAFRGRTKEAGTVV